MPEETEEAPPVVQLSICNVDRSIVNAVRSVSGEPITVTMSIVLASSPDVIEAGPITFVMLDVEYDAGAVTGTLAFEGDVLNQAYPSETFNPSDYPGLA